MFLSSSSPPCITIVTAGLITLAKNQLAVETKRLLKTKRSAGNDESLRTYCQMLTNDETRFSAMAWCWCENILSQILSVSFVISRHTQWNLRVFFNAILECLQYIVKVNSILTGRFLGFLLVFYFNVLLVTFGQWVIQVYCTAFIGF